MKFWKRLKKRIHKYLEKMAEKNKKLYGHKRLNCCGLNEDKKIKRPES